MKMMKILSLCSLLLQIVSLVKVSLSIGGLHFNGRNVRYAPGPGVDLTLEHARNLSIPLEGGVGRFLRIHLYFRDTWIVLGEIYFHSGQQIEFQLRI